MPTPSLDTLTQRLDRLERENRRLKIAGAFASLLVLALLVMGQAAPRTTRAPLESVSAESNFDDTKRAEAVRK